MESNEFLLKNISTILDVERLKKKYNMNPLLYLELTRAKAECIKLIKESSNKKNQKEEVKKNESRKPESKNDKILIYTDGGAIPNPGKGAYCGIIIDGEKKHLVMPERFIEDTTNNRMELSAVIKVIKRLKTLNISKPAVLYSDSKYVVDSVNKGWLENWILKKDYSRINYDLWESLRELLIDTKITFNWVKGHSDNYYNDLCDTLCSSTIKEEYNLPQDIKFNTITLN